MTERRPSLLVIDDEPDILEALTFLFEDEGYRVQASEKGDSAESLLDGNGEFPDLIILDVLLSGKDGRLICRALKRHAATAHIPVVMISAHPNAEQSIKDVGADAFVAKPFSIDDILATVAALLAVAHKDPPP